MLRCPQPEVLRYLVIPDPQLSRPQVCSTSESDGCSSQGREVVSRHELRVLLSSHRRDLRDEPADGPVGVVLVGDGGEIVYQVSLPTNNESCQSLLYHLEAAVELIAVREVDVRPEILLVGGGDGRGRAGLSSSLDDEETEESPGDTESSHTAEDTDEDQGGVAATGDLVDNVLQAQSVHWDSQIQSHFALHQARLLINEYFTLKTYCLHSRVFRDPGLSFNKRFWWVCNSINDPGSREVRGLLYWNKN